MFRDNRKLVLATAKHVLDFPENETVHWEIQQFSDAGEAVRQLAFSTNKSERGDVPYRTHNDLDVGIIVLPSLDGDKKPFALDTDAPVQTIDILQGVTPGTRVAWAGYPGLVEQSLGFPHLCYFEGVISAAINREQERRLLYIVDGHNMFGLSGGPVWHWSDEHDRLEVVGVVSGYAPLDRGLPGFCFFVPINPILYYLASEIWHPDKVGDHLIVNRYRPPRAATPSNAEQG
jgi:hypothetical protein